MVRVAGRFSVDQRYGAGITVRALRPAADGRVRPADLHDGPPIPFDQMVADLRALVATVQHPHLRELLDALLRRGLARVGAAGATPRRPSTTTRPTAHGLLEHCLSVAQGVSAIVATFPGIDRDVAVTGALLHDIGKIEAYD